MVWLNKSRLNCRSYQLQWSMTCLFAWDLCCDLSYAGTQAIMLYRSSWKNINLCEYKPQKSIEYIIIKGYNQRLFNLDWMLLPYTLPTDQTIHNRILSKVCCDGFTRRIRKTCNNQHKILLWIAIWAMLITESHAVSQLFLKLSFIIAFYYESLKISYSVISVWCPQSEQLVFLTRIDS